MAKAGTRKQSGMRVILPDSDKLGFVVAWFFATVVLAVNLFVYSVNLVETAYRVSLTFAVSWAVTAVAVHYVVSTMVAEVRAERRARKKARQAEEEVLDAVGAGEPPPPREG